MKKIIQILLCLLVSSTMLVGCGEDVGPTTYVAPQREAVNFDEMADCDFDEEVFSNAVQEMTTLSNQKTLSQENKRGL